MDVTDPTTDLAAVPATVPGMPRHPGRPSRWAAGAALAVAAVLAGCSTAAPTPPATAPGTSTPDCTQRLALRADGDGLRPESSTTLHPGPVRIVAEGADDQPHYVAAARLKGKTTPAGFLADMAALQRGGAAAAEVGPTVVQRFDLLGGLVTRQSTGSWVLDLPAGTYLMTDLSRAAEPGAADRVITLTVTGDRLPCAVPVDASLVATGAGARERFQISVDTVPAGGNVLVTNALARNAEVSFMPVAEQADDAAVTRWFAAGGKGASPFASRNAVGGLLPLAPGTTAVVPAAVRPGRYALVSWVEGAADEPYLHQLITVTG